MYEQQAGSLAHTAPSLNIPKVPALTAAIEHLQKQASELQNLADGLCQAASRLVPPQPSAVGAEAAKAPLESGTLEGSLRGLSMRLSTVQGQLTWVLGEFNRAI